MTDAALTLGVIGTSRKPEERRVPIHPAHFERLPDELARSPDRRGRVRRALRRRGRRAPAPSSAASRLATRSSRHPTSCSSPSPRSKTSGGLRDGQVLWGWPHLVQDERMTQLAVDKRLTIIAFEAMNHWGRDGAFGLHVFHMNNELAGYCSVLHALELCGSTGRLRPPAHRGRDRIRRDCARCGHGASRTRRARCARADQPPDGIGRLARSTPRSIIQFDHDDEPYLSEVITDDGRVPLAPFLAESDIVVNCTLQDPNHPLLYLRESDLERLPPGQPHRRRLVRRGHGVRVGPADVVRGSDVHRRTTRSTTTGWTTAPRTCGTRRAGRSARRCSGSSRP